MPDPVTGAAGTVAATAPGIGLATVALHTALALLAILAVIFAGFWLLRRYGSKFGLGPAGRGGMLRLMAHLTLGPRKSIIVVRFLDKDLVLGVTDQTITLLTEGKADHGSENQFAATMAQHVRSNDAAG